ncbi:sugar kinase [Subtercola vilae]|uniref:Sugar kinase n=1 Tax=Subtercola vilae TaxID=2056433 RepID=A0A4T2BYE1_9MICO|nr:sugar kinase [Subtercola vilae]
MRVVTMGETMGSFSSERAHPLMRGQSLSLSHAGSESNVAVALSRLGVTTRWVGCVGDDAVGRMIVRELRAEGVDVQAHVIAGAATATMVKERLSPEHWSVGYNRSSSAGSRLSPAHTADALTPQTELLHVTGITLALGGGPRRAVLAAISRARAANVLVSLDVNHRLALWSAESAGAVLRKVLPFVDIVFASAHEAQMLCEGSSPSELAEQLGQSGVPEVVLTMGAAGSVAYTPASGLVECPARPATVVDPVGAGDAFVAGYLAARLEGEPLTERLALGTALGHAAVSTAGDWEGSPSRAQLAATMGDDVSR